MKNEFDIEVRKWFIDCWECWLCQKNGQDCGGLELHHVLGRISSCILNASVLCHECHSHVGHTDGEHSDLLIKTIKFLLRMRYEFTEREITFYKEHKKLYGIS